MTENSESTPSTEPGDLANALGVPVSLESVLIEQTVFPPDEFPDPDQTPEDLGTDQDTTEVTA